MPSQHSIIPFLLRSTGLLILIALLVIGLALVAGSFITSQTISLTKSFRQGDQFVDILHLLDVRIGVDVQVSNEPIPAYSLAWSPDGKSIIFIKEIGRIYIWDKETNKIRQLDLQGLSGFGNILWGDGQTVFLTLANNTYGNVFRFNIVTGNLQQLTFFDEEKITLWDIAPDKSFLLFTLGQQQYQLRREIYRINTDGTDLRRLGSTNVPKDFAPQLSPDGQHIAYVIENHAILDIALMDTDGNNSQQLTETDDFETVPLWSPDGQHILYKSFSTVPQAINIMDADGTNKKVLFSTEQISPYAALYGEPAWSSDGNQILFDATISGPPQNPIIQYVYVLYVMNADGSKVRELYRSNERWVVSFAWQP